MRVPRCSDWRTKLITVIHCRKAFGDFEKQGWTVTDSVCPPCTGQTLYMEEFVPLFRIISTLLFWTIYKMNLLKLSG